MKKVVWILILFLPALVLAGCGGDDVPEETTTTTVEVEVISPEAMVMPDEDLEKAFTLARASEYAKYGTMLEEFHRILDDGRYRISVTTNDLAESENPGCGLALIVDIVSETVEPNWMCTGAILDDAYGTTATTESTSATTESTTATTESTTATTA